MKPTLDPSLVAQGLLLPATRRLSLAISLASLVAMPSLPPPVWAEADDRCAKEIAIQGAYVSECMRDPTRQFEWPNAGKLTIEQGSVGPGSTGAAVWQAGSVLSRHLVANPSLVEGRKVIELGCGTGLCGMVAARLGASTVLLTDGVDPVLERAARNVERNGLVEGSRGGSRSGVRTRKLLWGELPLDVELRGAFDVVLASDVLYQSSAWRGFAQTVSELLRPRDGILLLAEAGHENTPTMSTLAGFKVVADGAGLRVGDAFEADGSPAGSDALLITATAS